MTPRRITVRVYSSHGKKGFPLSNSNVLFLREAIFTHMTPTLDPSERWPSMVHSQSCSDQSRVFKKMSCPEDTEPASNIQVYLVYHSMTGNDRKKKKRARHWSQAEQEKEEAVAPLRNLKHWAAPGLLPWWGATRQTGHFLPRLHNTNR